MSERHPVLAAWDRLAEKLRKEGLTKHEVRFEIPCVDDYFALVWVEVFDRDWQVVASTTSSSWATYDETDIKDLTHAAIHAVEFVRLVRRTHLILESEASAIAAIDLATEA